MSKSAQCYFSLSYGLQGCYMPDSHYGPFQVSRRKDLIDAVRDTLDFLDAPKSAIRQVQWKRLWAQAKRNGTSSIHFCIALGQHNMLEFHGMTETEFKEAELAND